MVEFFRDGIAEMIGERLNLVFCNKDEALGWAQSDNLDVAVEKLKENCRYLCHHLRRRWRIDL